LSVIEAPSDPEIVCSCTVAPANPEVMIDASKRVGKNLVSRPKSILSVIAATDR
jgi:hypothetical protein